MKCVSMGYGGKLWLLCDFPSTSVLFDYFTQDKSLFSKLQRPRLELSISGTNPGRWDRKNEFKFKCDVGDGAEPWRRGRATTVQYAWTACPDTAAALDPAGGASAGQGAGMAGPAHGPAPQWYDSIHGDEHEANSMSTVDLMWNSIAMLISDTTICLDTLRALIMKKTYAFIVSWSKSLLEFNLDRERETERERG